MSRPFIRPSMSVCLCLLAAVLVRILWRLLIGSVLTGFLRVVLRCSGSAWIVFGPSLPLTVDFLALALFSFGFPSPWLSLLSFVFCLFFRSSRILRIQEFFRALCCVVLCCVVLLRAVVCFAFRCIAFRLAFGFFSCLCAQRSFQADVRLLHKVGCTNRLLKTKEYIYVCDMISQNVLLSSIRADWTTERAQFRSFRACFQEGI